MKKNIIFLSILIFFAACGSNERVSKEVFDQVNESMKVKKLSEADIMKGALEWGEEISGEAQKELITALQEAISEKGVPGAIRFCQVEALPILKKVADQYGVTVRRASFDYRNPEDKPSPEEEPILDTYVYNMENELANEPNVQKLENGEVLLFTKAIQIPNALCLNCHGKPNEDISAETLAVIDELYPDDKAKNHQIGDLRGMWSIRIPKKELVKKL